MAAQFTVRQVRDFIYEDWSDEDFPHVEEIESVDQCEIAQREVLVKQWVEVG